MIISSNYLITPYKLIVKFIVFAHQMQLDAAFYGNSLSNFFYLDLPRNFHHNGFRYLAKQLNFVKCVLFFCIPRKAILQEFLQMISDLLMLKGRYD